uniref:Condensin complex subunit 2 n=1 Tax=Syphacia muris TaxID=451379 RepID=A0A0N5AE64_9BILA
MRKRRHIASSPTDRVDVSDNDEEEVYDIAKNRISHTTYNKLRITTSTAFYDDLIDRLPEAVEKETLVHSAALLDTSVRIYSSRVDNTFTQVFEVKRHLGKETPVHPDADTNCSLVENRPSISDSSGISSEIEKTVKASWVSKNYDLPKQCINRHAPHRPLTTGVEAKYTLPRFNASNMFLTELLDAECFLINYEKDVKKASQENRKRREEAGLNQHYLFRRTVNPIYEKAARNFTEGSCRGLLLVNAITNLNATVVVLHNYADLITSDPSINVDVAELIGVYESVLYAEKSCDRIGFDEDERNLCIMEHNFNLATQHLLLNIENDAGATFIELLLNQDDMSFGSSITDPVIYSLKVVQAVILRNLRLCVRNWLTKRMFLHSETVLEKAQDKKESDSRTCSIPLLLSCFEKSIFWIPHFKKLVNEEMSIGRVAFDKNSNVFFYAEDQIIAEEVEWRKNINGDVQTSDLSDNETFIDNSGIKFEDEESFKENIEGINVDGENCVCDGVVDGSHWQTSTCDRQVKKKVHTTNACEIASVPLKIDNDNDGLLNPKHNVSRHSECHGVIPDNECYTKTEEDFSDLELSLYNGENLTENPEVEKIPIDGSEGIFAKWLIGLPQESFEIFYSGDENDEKITLSSLLGRIRFELMGSLDNFTVIDTFLALLHVANEENLELIQSHDKYGMVTEQGLSEIFINDRSQRTF